MDAKSTQLCIKFMHLVFLIKKIILKKIAKE